MKNFILTLGQIILISFFAYAQNCELMYDPFPTNIAPVRIELSEANVTMSSFVVGHEAKYLIDNEINNGYALTEYEDNPYVEYDFGKSMTFSHIAILEEQSIHQEGLSGYYILVSDQKFGDNGLQSLLASSCVQYLMIEEPQNGEDISLSGMQGRYLRVQSGDPGVLAIGDNPVFGLDEDCDNGIDDDGDGLVDCHDNDCGPVIVNVFFQVPLCSTLEDGSISVLSSSGSVNGRDLLYSLDGGTTFLECSPASPTSMICEFSGLGVGTYDLVVFNPETGCETAYGEVKLENDEECPEALCDNGGFDEGDFSNWTAQQGIHDSGIKNLVDVDPNTNDGFEILQSGSYNDFWLGTMNSPTNSNFILSLGQNPLSGGRDVFTLTNCFTVTTENANFGFLYALILENPDGHDDDELPFFQWVIRGPDGLFIAGDEVIPGSDFFEGDENDPISTRGWSCAQTELSEWIGEEVCVELMIAECSLSGHGAYAYIDGICQDSDELGPSCDFEILDEVVCTGTGFELVFRSGQAIYDQFTIDICDGQGNCTSNSHIDGFNTADVNPLTLVQGSNVQLVNGEPYTARISLKNECGECTQDLPFVFYGISPLLNYPKNIYVCGSPNEVSIPGDVQCQTGNSCIISWSPAAYLDDPNSMNPNILGWRFVDAFEKTYEIEVTEQLPNGDFVCPLTERVTVFSDFEIEYDFKTVDYCSEKLTGSIHSRFPISPDDFDFNLEVVVPGSNIVFDITNVEQGEDNFSLYFEYDLSRDFTGNPQALLNYAFLGNQYAVTVDPNCYSTFSLGTVASGMFKRTYSVSVPEIMSPPLGILFIPSFISPLANDICYDLSNPAQYTLSSIYWAKLEIFNEWGGRVYSREAEVPISSQFGLTGAELTWDGTDSGVHLNSGVFTYVLQVKSCPRPVLLNCKLDDCGDHGRLCKEDVIGETGVLGGSITIMN